MRSCAPRAPPGQSDPLPRPARVNPPGAVGNKDKRKTEVEISLEAVAKFQTGFFLILLALKLDFSSEGKFSEITSLAPPQAQAALAQSSRTAPYQPALLGNCAATAGQESLGPAEENGQQGVAVFCFVSGFPLTMQTNQNPLETKGLQVIPKDKDFFFFSNR